ncbi:efflux RND transporter permease subunit [Aureibacter tunicatorum]|uniref:HAE1 family hydrophobic/amphiphilic exporter-1 n=1 Tax=Aureibacter tunicatorum TaxID=866807 RepID=A0AAE3XQQ7_9BACT|nr:efflux RND transporter permease subunit [Aureibacter tunicatorum]MDR6240181.1 HAE1 family hydrophobic/amphiphilic exporter-1 [Aureibacter tunicatorum]BDD05938.1 nodulation protein NolG [Aureibacter tunicatorum]
MSLAEVSVKEPVFITMIVVAIVVLGLFAAVNLKVSLQPDVNFPYVSVTTTLEGATPEVVNDQISEKIEKAVNTVSGIKHITSVSQKGLSQVIIEFDLKSDPVVSEEKVRSKVDAILEKLPRKAKKPVVQQFDVYTPPVMSLVVTGEGSEKEITLEVKNVISKVLESVDGVGRVEIVGGAEPQVRVECDNNKLKAYGVSLNDVVNAINAENVEISAGEFDWGSYETLVSTKSKFKEVAGFDSVVLSYMNGEPVYLSNVAEVVNGSKKPTSLSQLNGNNALGLNIVKQTNANSMLVAEGIKEKIKFLEKSYNGKIKIIPIVDVSNFIKSENEAVFVDLILGFLLTVLVVYVFLANFKATVIGGIALFTSLVASFIMMYLMNFSINYMTMLGLTLSLGLLIDDAIVIIENIFRHLTRDKVSPKAAVVKASNEISLAVLSTTMTIVAVFLPVAFMPGLIGEYFFQFGLTVVFAVLVSLFVAFTLTPMLSAQWISSEDLGANSLSKKTILNRFHEKFNQLFDRLIDGYTKFLRASLAHKKRVVGIAFGILLVTFYLFSLLGTDFIPVTDVGQFIIKMKVDPGGSLEESGEVSKQLVKVLLKDKRVTNVYTSIGAAGNPVTEGEISVLLVPKNKRKEGTEEIKNYYRNIFKDIPGVEFSYLGSPGSNDEQSLIEYHINGLSLDSLSMLAERLQAIYQRIPGVVDIQNDLAKLQPEYKINVDRLKAAKLGLHSEDIGNILRTALNGDIASYYDIFGDQLEVFVQLRRSQVRDIEDLMSVNIKSENGDLVPISSIATYDRINTLNKIVRYDRKYSVSVTANLYQQLLGDAMAEIQKNVSELDMPTGYNLTQGGYTQIQSQSTEAMIIVFLFSLMFIYMILASLFRSYKQPMIIMLSLPFSLLGAVVMLLAFHNSLSLMAMMGLIMLLGLVTKNAILLINYANQMKLQGETTTEALVLAGKVRLKPILMTSAAMVFGMIPIAFSNSLGASFRAPMGKAVMGGIISSTIFTLIFIPVVYDIIDKIFMNKRHKKTAEDSNSPAV